MGAVAGARSWPPTSATSSLAGDATPVVDPASGRVRRRSHRPAGRALAVQTSNMAGYRAGFVAGDPTLVASLIAVRRHPGRWCRARAGRGGGRGGRRARARAGGAGTAAAGSRCGTRWSAGSQVEHSEAGLYLWAPRASPDADRPLVRRARHPGGPGSYGPAGARHVRVALTAPTSASRRPWARLAA